jgi:hypothetical protein
MLLKYEFVKHIFKMTVIRIPIHFSGRNTNNTLIPCCTLRSS